MRARRSTASAMDRHSLHAGRRTRSRLVRHGGDLADVRARLDAPARAFADAAGFEPKAGRHLLLPGQRGPAACCSASRRTAT